MGHYKSVWDVAQKKSWGRKQVWCHVPSSFTNETSSRSHIKCRLASTVDFKILRHVTFFVLAHKLRKTRFSSDSILRHQGSVNTRESLKRVSDISGKPSMSYATTFHRFCVFKRGLTSMKVNQRTDRLLTAVTEEDLAAVERCFREYPRLNHNARGEFLLIISPSMMTILHERLCLTKGYSR